jgi:hypothetical protein
MGHRRSRDVEEPALAFEGQSKSAVFRVKACEIAAERPLHAFRHRPIDPESCPTAMSRGWVVLEAVFIPG